MSIVGTRPPLIGEVSEYELHHRARLATSYRIKEEGRTFKSEYIISQSIMMACKRLGYDGVAYYSKRVYDEVFALHTHTLLYPEDLK